MVSMTSRTTSCKQAVRLLPQALRQAQSGTQWAAFSTTTGNHDPKKTERVVVLGSGWAGYSFARTLSPKTKSTILISPRSYFVFTPLLASTSVGTLEFRAIVEPARRLAIQEFHHAWATDVDFANKVIRVKANSEDSSSLSVSSDLAQNRNPEYEIPYDKLVLAVGCSSQSFGIEGVKEYAHFLKDVGDARRIRLKVLQAFERSSLPTTSDEERKNLLHFVIVGGGPTGIEFGAELHDLIHDDLSKLYPNLIQHVSISVYDISSRILPMFDQSLANYATQTFRRRGIEVKTEHHVQRIRQGEDDTLLLKIKEYEEEVPAGLVVWSTGLAQNPLVGKIIHQEIQGIGKLAEDQRTGGFLTDSHLRVQLRSPGKDADATTTTTTLPDVFAIGDCAVIKDGHFPATAQVASQQAVYLAKQINKGAIQESSAPFKFRNWGTLTYLGNWQAIHQSKADELKGTAAWILWRAAYLTRSMSIRNKIMVPVYWVITWLFGRDVSRF